MDKSKQEIVAAIRQYNPSAAEGFLFRFDEPALKAYLQRLSCVHGQRGPHSVWVRPAFGAQTHDGGGQRPAA